MIITTSEEADTLGPLVENLNCKVFDFESKILEPLPRENGLVERVGPQSNPADEMHLSLAGLGGFALAGFRGRDGYKNGYSREKRRADILTPRPF